MQITFSKLTYIILGTIALLFGASAWMPVLKQIAIGADVVWLIILIIDFVVTPSAKLITGGRDVNERLSIGRENKVVIRLTNMSSKLVQCVGKDDYPDQMQVDFKNFVFELPPAGMALIDYKITPRQRGLYRFGNFNIRYRSSLGLFRKLVRVDVSKEIKVFSDLHALQELSLKLSRSSAQGEFHQRKRGHGTDFSSLREYASGDPADKIDWKATARRDRPIIRTYETEQEQRLVILLDAGRMMASDLGGLSRFDHALNAALALTLTGLTFNDQVGFGIFSDKPLAYLPPRRGKGYLKKILEITYDIHPTLVEPDYGGALAHFASLQKGRCLIVVFTDLTDPLGSKSLLQGLSNLSPRHLPFCVTLTDKQILEKSNRLISDENEPGKKLDSVFQRAVALDLIAQRELALSVLQRQGCLILDCPPEDLSNKIVNKYLEIKMRNSL